MKYLNTYLQEGILSSTSTTPSDGEVIWEAIKDDFYARTISGKIPIQAKLLSLHEGILNIEITTNRGITGWLPSKVNKDIYNLLKGIGIFYKQGGINLSLIGEYVFKKEFELRVQTGSTVCIGSNHTQSIKNLSIYSDSVSIYHKLSEKVKNLKFINNHPSNRGTLNIFYVHENILDNISIYGHDVVFDSIPFHKIPNEILGEGVVWNGKSLTDWRSVYNYLDVSLQPLTREECIDLQQKAKEWLAQRIRWRDVQRVVFNTIHNFVISIYKNTTPGRVKVEKYPQSAISLYI